MLQAEQPVGLITASCPELVYIYFSIKLGQESMSLTA